MRGRTVDGAGAGRSRAACAHEHARDRGAGLCVRRRQGRRRDHELAVNTAAALGRVAKGDVLLIDMHMATATVRCFWVSSRASPSSTRSRTFTAWMNRFWRVWSKRPSPGSTCSPRHPPIARATDENRCALLEAASRMYRMTVLDVPRSDMTHSRLAGCGDQHRRRHEPGNRVAAKCSQHGRDAAPSLRHGRVKVVINSFHRESVIAHADIERAVGGSRRAPDPERLPFAVEALNAGRPLAMDRDSKLGGVRQPLREDLAGSRANVRRTARHADALRAGDAPDLTTRTGYMAPATTATDTRNPQYQALKGRIHQDLLSRLNLDRLTKTSRTEAEPEIRGVIQELLDKENQRVPLSLFDREIVIETCSTSCSGLGRSRRCSRIRRYRTFWSTRPRRCSSSVRVVSRKPNRLS